MLLTVVVVTHNALDHLKRCLDSLGRHTGDGTPYELIVVDNGSTDGTDLWLSSLGDHPALRRAQRARQIRNPENRWYPAALNQALALASGEFVAVLNDDVVVTECWAQGLIEVLRTARRAGVAGPLLGNGLGTPILSYFKQDLVSRCAGLEPEATLAAYGSPPGPGLDTLARRLRRRYGRKATRTKQLCDACWIMRREVWEAVGPFDEGFRVSGEDWEYSLRVRMAGWRLYVADGVYVHHAGRGSKTGLGAQFLWWLERQDDEHFQQRWQELLRGTPLENSALDEAAMADAFLNDRWVWWFERDPAPGTPSGPPSSPYETGLQVAVPPIPVRRSGAIRLVSIIVPSHNALGHLRETLEHLDRYTDAPYELLVVDDASTDGSEQWLAAYQPASPCCRGYRVLRNPQRFGWAFGCNRGMEAASGDAFLLLNADVLVTEGWLSALLAHLESLPLAGAVGPIGYGLWLDQDYGFLYGEPPYLHTVRAPAHPPGGRCDAGERVQADEGLQAFARRLRQSAAGSFTETPVLIDACLLVPRTVIWEVGMQDPDLQMDATDFDLCLRIRLAGYRTYVAEDVYVHHHRHASRWKIPGQAEKQRQSYDYFYRKWADLFRGGRPPWNQLFREVRCPNFSGLCQGRRAHSEGTPGGAPGDARGNAQRTAPPAPPASEAGS